MSDRGCEICGAVKHPQAYACPRCKRIIDRVETRTNPDGTGRHVDRLARRRALRESWRDGAFHCWYTGVELVEDDWRDHRYLSFEHLQPCDEASVVVCSALVNRMKTDMSEAEFERLVLALADRFRTGEFDQRGFPEGKRPTAPAGC